ncbi:MAG: hydrolase [Deltaproteobacteria bacterium]|nr:hydrolase [Deltaproteobacteria bacterium]
MVRDVIKAFRRVRKKSRPGWKRLLRGAIGFLCGLISLVLVLLIWAWPELGTLPSGEHLEAISMSPNYDKDRGRFVNRKQAEYDKMIAKFDYLSLMKAQIFGTQIRTPPKGLPYESSSIEDFVKRTELSYIWLGHSTVLMRLDNLTILFDPIFTNAAPLPFLVPRFQEPVISLQQLPPIDVIVISHDHYDHLDKPTVEHFLGTETKFLVPLGVSSHLIGWGVPKKSITEHDWWDKTTISGVDFHCTPSQHFSGRLGPRGSKTLWASWSVLGDSQRVFFSGDSGYDIHFQKIGERLGPFDVAFMESGQYNPIWYMAHMFPEEAVRGALELKAKYIHPIHWGMFRLSTHDWFDPPLRIRTAASDDISVLFPKIGQEVIVSEYVSQNQPWWEILKNTP